MNILVEETDALGAEASKCSKCLMANALKRVFNTEHVCVLVATAMVDGKQWRINKRGSQCIVDFDNGKPIAYPVPVELSLVPGQEDR